MVELIKSNDGLVRGAKVKVGKTRNVIRRPVIFNFLIFQVKRFPNNVFQNLHCF